MKYRAVIIMYAIFQTGGKQHTVREGDVVDVDLLPRVSSTISFQEVLCIHDEGKLQLGSPFVPGAYIEAEFCSEVKGKKVISFKYKRRKNYHRKKGHRQRYARVHIKRIVTGSSN